MRLSKVYKICKSSGSFILYNKVEESGEVTQYLSDGIGLYPMDRMPLLNVDTLVRVVDLTAKQIEKTTLRERELPESIDISDSREGDILLEDTGVEVWDGGRDLKLLATPSGKMTVWVQASYLAPVQSDTLGFVYRELEDGKRYIVMKNGLLFAGLVMPFQGLTERARKYLTAALDNEEG